MESVSNQRRSLLLNEDDYDYAIELIPDDQYRLVAEVSDDIIDFDDVDLSKYQKFVKVTEVTFNSNIENDGEANHGNDPNECPLNPMNDKNNWIDFISKEEFTLRIRNLEKRKKWIEKSARRSSIRFSKHNYNYSEISDQACMNLFLLTLAKGVIVRRHQRFLLAEKVKLFSHNGCKLIQWETPKEKRKSDNNFKNTSGQKEQDFIYVSKYDDNGFDCCAKSNSANT